MYYCYCLLLISIFFVPSCEALANFVYDPDSVLSDEQIRNINLFVVEEWNPERNCISIVVAKNEDSVPDNAVARILEHCGLMYDDEGYDNAILIIENKEQQCMQMEIIPSDTSRGCIKEFILSGSTDTYDALGQIHFNMKLQTCLFYVYHIAAIASIVLVIAYAYLVVGCASSLHTDDEQQCSNDFFEQKAEANV